MMKHNHAHHNAPTAGPQLARVRFEFTHPTATTASVTGTFNDWHPTTKSMHPSGNGHTVFVNLSSEAVERSPERGLVTAGAGDERPIPLY